MSHVTLLAQVFEALPTAAFVADSDAVILLANRLGRLMVHETPEELAANPRRAGTLLRCVHADNPGGGCGRGTACPDCDLRGLVGEAIRSGQPTRRPLALTLESESGPVRVPGHAAAAPLQLGEDTLVVLTLQEDPPAPVGRPGEAPPSP